ncbi:methyltransferase [Actinosynnema sp. NPDC020468]|uniref:methyltransferase n=1 Tax=Actinosynnema sp. NPDC020468 TaxID=3154488 RepID=UPI0033D5CD20
MTGSLWSARPTCGDYEFRGSTLRIEVTDPEEVLFPTDCGLSLLGALQTDTTFELANKTVLDVGAGSGVYTVALLAAGAAHVTALDVNTASAAATRANVLRNGLDADRLTCVTSDLAEYAPTGRFDLVVTNPPHLPHDPSYTTAEGLEVALVAGRDGRSLYDVVVARADDLVAPGGTLLVAHSSLADVGRTTRELGNRGYTARTLEVYEMDIPLLAYAEHKQTLLGHLERLRDSGSATFEGDRFTVHAVAFQRPATTGEPEETR